MSDIPTLDAFQTQKILDEIAKWPGEIRDELGEIRTEILPTGRVLVLSDTEVPHVAYMSDDSPEARLCLDDFVPELGDFTMNPEFPSDAQP